MLILCTRTQNEYFLHHTLFLLYLIYFLLFFQIHLIIILELLSHIYLLVLFKL